MNGQNCTDFTITQHPLSTTVCLGQPVTFSTACTGQNVTFQWRKEGQPITGATNANFTINATVGADIGNYDVVVSSVGCPNLTSNQAFLTVNDVPPAPYVGDHHAACGCQNATAKAQHRDAFFQAIPNLTFVWFDNPNGTGTPLPATMSNNISLCNITSNSTIYAFEVAKGCYSPPSEVAMTIFPLPTTTPSVFNNNIELSNFQTLRSCESSVVLTATTTIPNGTISWYETSNRSTLLATGNTYTVTNSQTVFVFETPQNQICTSTGGENLMCYGTPKEISVLILPKPAVSLGPDQILCPGGTKTLTPIITGNPPFEYLWSNGATTPSITISTPNTYSVTVTNSDFFRCSVSDDVIVSATTLNVTLGADKTICPGTSTSLTTSVSGGTAPFTYMWSNLQTPPSVTVGAGTYQVTVTDANGCIKTDEVIVSVANSNLIANAGADKTICTGATTSLTAMVSGGTAPFSYVWSNGVITVQGSTITVGVGTYRLTVTDASGCSGTDEVIVSTANALNVNAGADKSVCSGATTLLSVAASGGSAPFSYLWSNLQTTPSVTVGAGTYRVTVTDASGCSGSDEVIVTTANVLNVNAGADKSVCAGATTLLSVAVSGGSAPFSYLWSNLQTTPSVTVGAGTYRVTVSDASGCSGSDEVIVTTANALSVNAGADKKVCTGATTTLTANVSGGTSPYYYIWSSGHLTPSVTVSAGTYRVTVLDGSGCSGSDEVVVSLDPNALQAIIQQSNNRCFGTSDGQISIIPINGVPPYSYSINNGATWSPNSNFYNLPAGVYPVVVKANSGCTFSKTITITESPVVSFTTNAQSSCNGNSIKFDNVTGGNGAPYQYSINYGDEWKSNSTFANLDPGTYYVRVRDAFGCMSAIKTVLVSTSQNMNFTLNIVNGGCSDGGGSVTIANVSGGVPPYQYSKNGGNTWQTSPIFTNLVAGQYAMRVRDANLCVSNTQSVQITQSTLTATIQQINNRCFGTADGSISITASGGSLPYQYSIDNGAKWFSTANFYNLAAGDYIVKAKDNGGCTFSKLISITQGAAISFTATTTPPSCYGLTDGKISMNVNNNGNFKYSIDYGNTFSNNKNFTNLNPGIYYLRVQDAAGCFSEVKPIEVTQPTPISFQTVVQNVACNGVANGIIGVHSVIGGTPQYRYSKNGGDSYQNTNSFLFLTVGKYGIRVKDSKGCESPTKDVVIIKNCGSPNSLTQAPVVQKIKVVIRSISPNPTNDFIHVELNSLKADEQVFQFFDVLGRYIMTEKRMLEEGVQRLEFDVSNLPQGVYQIVTVGSYARNVQNRFVKY